MRLSQQTRNAVSVLVQLAKAANRSLTVPEIAKACDITEYNTFKLVPVLVRGGFLRTIRGRNGGVELAIPADDISIGSVVRATEQSLQTDAMDAKAGDSQASFETMVDDALLAFVEILDQNTIAELTGCNAKAKVRKPKKKSARARSSANPN